MAVRYKALIAVLIAVVALVVIGSGVVLFGGESHRSPEPTVRIKPIPDGK